jgi:hypothetical protein
MGSAQFVEAATRRFRETLAERLDAHMAAGIDIRQLLGDPGALGERAVQALVPEPSPWNALLGPFTRTEGVQARLGGISRQAVASKAARGRLLQLVTQDGVRVYPIWQFMSDGQVLPGLPEVLATFRGSGIDNWTLAGWLRSVDPGLGEAPYEALVRGEAARVLAAARAARHTLAA